MNEQKLPLVSIIMPTYNQGHLIEKAINSVILQTYSNWELIIIDNFSTDNTSQIAKKYISEKIKFFQYNNSGIIACSRNIGIKNANGFWLAFLDSDDFWKIDKLEKCINIYGGNYDFIYHDLRLFDNSKYFKKKRSLKSRKINIPYYKDLIIHGNPIGNSSVLVKKNLLIDINYISESKDIIGCEDFDTWLKITNTTDKILYINEVLGYYYLNPKGVSKKDISIPYLNVINKYLFEFSKDEKEIIFSNLAYTNARYEFLNHNYHKALISFKKSLYSNRLDIRIKSLLSIIYLSILHNNAKH